ncbi:MAG: Flp family type IVb pilin [Sphingomonas sp.]|nr:Flp family type IVb pilin [Sphingomonas sp.]
MVKARLLVRDERGATAIEYALIAALISMACIIAFMSLGLNLSDVFNTAGNAMG